MAFNFEISIDVLDPIFPFVTIEDATAGGVLIGDQVDDRGGNAWGDPHLVTFDNVAYDFQASGDFILARATEGDPYEVQARFTALNSAVSVTQAIATAVGASTVSIEAGADGGTVRIDDTVLDLTDGETVAVGAGFVTRTGRNIEIDHGNGDFTLVDVFSSFLNVTPSPSLARVPGSLEGLLGDADGNPGNEFQLEDGTVLSTPLPIDTLYGDYAQSWLVEANASLLPGDAEPFVPPGRIITIDSLPDSLRQAAEAAVDAAGITNPLLREAAILDFALTNNPEFIEAAQLVDEVFNPIVDTVPVDPVSNPAVILTADQTLLNEEDAGGRTVTLTVARGSAEGELGVNYSVAGAGASPADADDFDGTLPSGALLFQDGQDTITFEVEISDDDLDEGQELFDVAIALDGANADDYEVLVSSVRVAVEDDDEATINQVVGTVESDYLQGTEGDDEIRSLDGRYDRMSGGQGADRFVFGAEVFNSSRERDVIDDFEFERDLIVLEDGASVGAVRQTSSGVALFFDGDGDAVYIHGQGLTPDNLSIVESDLLLT